MKKLLIFAVVATMFAACSKDATQDLAAAKPIDKFYATIADNDSRVQLNDVCKTVWTSGDRVSIFNKTAGNECWQFNGETGDRVGEFTKVGGVAGDAANKVFAVYPYKDDNTLLVSGGMIYTTIPTTQKYVKGSFGEGGNVMIAIGESADLSFRHIFGWFKVQLSGDYFIKSITLRDPNSREFLAGGKVLLYPDTGLVVSAEKSASLTLDCGDGVQLTETPTDFYIALIPQTFENGLDIEITATTGRQKKISVSHSVSVARNHIVPIKNYELGKHYSIIYTTSDNKPASINKTHCSDAVVTNTYNNGMGVITFTNASSMKVPSRLFSECGNLISVLIPDGVTSIGSYAFSGCTSLASIAIPDSVTSIGDYLFDGCTSLTSVTIPDSVTSIGWSAFSGCTSLTSVTIGNGVTSIGRSAFEGCTGLTSVHINDIAAWCSIKFDSARSNPIMYAHNLYLNSNLVTNLVIPDSVTTIGEYAFSGCASLTSVTIPDSVTSIGYGAFSNCIGLTSVTLPNNVTEIDDFAFSGCTGMTSITIPNSITLVGNLGTAFGGCAGLTSVHINDIAAWCSINFDGTASNPLYYAHNLYLNGNLVTDLVIPDSVTSIGWSAFYGCTSLTSVTIPDSVTVIGSDAFRDCTSLTSVTIPDSVTVIGSDAFRDCTSLTSVTIPDSVTRIGEYAFKDCTNLTSLTIGKGVASIRKYAFQGCTGLTSVTIGNSVTSIGEYAFEGCTGLTSVTIPDSVTSIGNLAFFGCTGLTSVTIGTGVAEICSAAFNSCTSLTSIYCKPTTPPTLGNSDVFYNIAIDAKIYVPRASLNTYKSSFSDWENYAWRIVGYDF